MKKILYAAIFFLSLTGGSAFAQQQPQFSHYAFNGMYLSPGYAGMNKATEFNLIGRYQWFNYNADFNDEGGSPKTGLFNVSIPVRALKGGIGVNIAWDDIAATNISSGSLSYAYHLNLGGGVLGIGAQGIVTNIEKGSGYRYIDPFDEKIPMNSSDTKADLGAGLWYQADKFYLGAGINNLLGSTYQFETEKVVDNQTSKASVTAQKHLYISGGYNIDASSSLVVTPTALMKYDFDNKPSFDLGARGTFNETWWVGLNYRHQEAVTGLLGINLLKDKSMRVGYAFDFTTFGKDAKATGSHELLLSFRIPQSPLATKPAIRTPRYSF
jgi:type IX secretion system PorP/SprF family membrane protein